MSEITKNKISQKRKGVPSPLKGTRKSEKIKARGTIAQKKRFSPSFNTKGYQVLTSSGFQDFDGVAYKGLVKTLKITLSDQSIICCSLKHQFSTPSGLIQAKDCNINIYLTPILYIIKIEDNGKKPVYDLLEVKGDHTYITNNVISHNCEVVRDEDSHVIPEFTPEKETEIVKEWVKPAYFDVYVGGDIGVKDFTFFLYGYYDFKNGKIIIEDETVLHGQKWTTEALALSINEKETLHFTNPVTKDRQKPYLRVCDNNLTVINDLHTLHKLSFTPTAKDDAYMAINNIRILIKQGRIIINPRCKHLLAHIKYASWNKSRQSFNRSPDYGHYDGVHALTYFCRAVQQGKNPYPASFGHGVGDNWWNLNPDKDTKTSLPPESIKAIQNVFKIRSSLRRK
jgi:hypothetical protein